VVVAMCIPLIALGAVYIYRGLIRFDERKNSAYPSIGFAFLASGGGLTIRALMDFEILEYGALWIVTSAAASVIAALFITGTRELKFKKPAEYFTAAAIAAIVLGYTFGVYVMGNCVFDRSTPEVFTAKVMGKETSSGKTTSYYLILSAWGPRTEAERATVTEEQYQAAEEGDVVDVYLMHGLFSTPWFYISEHRNL